MIGYDKKRNMIKVLETDIKRIKICIEYKDYYSAMEYAIFVKDKYDNEEKEYFDNIIKCVKSGDYNKI